MVASPRYSLLEGELLLLEVLLEVFEFRLGLESVHLGLLTALRQLRQLRAQRLLSLCGGTQPADMTLDIVG